MHIFIPSVYLTLFNLTLLKPANVDYKYFCHLLAHSDYLRGIITELLFCVIIINIRILSRANEVTYMIVARACSIETECVRVFNRLPANGE